MCYYNSGYISLYFKNKFMPKPKHQKQMEAEERKKKASTENTSFSLHHQKSIVIHPVYNKLLFEKFNGTGQGGLTYRSIGTHILY